MFFITASKTEITLAIVIGFIFTLLLYGTFPMVFASVRKKPITKRRFALICIVATVAIWLAWQAVKSGTGGKVGNSGPASLWGIIFYEVAKRKLSRRGILCDVMPSKKEKAAKPEETEYAVDPSFVQTEIPFFDQEKQKETQTEETRVYSPLDPPEKHKKRYAPLWLTICLSVTCLALVSSCVFLYAQIEKLNTENQELSTALATSASKYSSLNGDYLTLRSDYKKLEASYTHAVDRINETIKWFCRVGFISKNSNHYHSYWCDEFQGTVEFWAHNVEYCEYLGYSPCPHCWK